MSLNTKVVIADVERFLTNCAYTAVLFGQSKRYMPLGM